MARLVRFGSLELDLETADLRNNGRSVRLPEQQFQLLRILLERNGSLVSRDEIRRQLWPNDTVVEFDRSINAAIMKLRITLGDTADKPVFIETLARRGYRFLVAAEFHPLLQPENVVTPVKHGSLVGSKVLHYRILDILGGGGMGLVYRGEDLHLNRPVALKFLPEEVAQDTHALRRLEREAQTASSLNHPNICTIYQVEEYNGQPFIVMELLEGETLRTLIARRVAVDGGKPSGLPLEQGFDLAAQIVEGLQAAHKKGIIHRDIKPANIFVTSGGYVKILDFGLAKVNAPEMDRTGTVAPEAGVPEIPNHIPAAPVDLTLSRFGAGMGTVGYMSPEQIRGEHLDSRTDLFSFGLILFEMVTGRRAFPGETPEEVKALILHSNPPPVRQLIPSAPIELERLITKCLEKEPDLRFPDASEIRDELFRLKRDAGSLRVADLNRMERDSESGNPVTADPESKPDPRSRRKRVLKLLLPGAALLVGLTIAVWYMRRPLPPPRISEYKQLTFDGHDKFPVGTDGARLYFNLNQGFDYGIRQMAVSGGVSEPVPIELPYPVALSRGLSPDGSSLFVSSVTGISAGGKLWIVHLPGSSPRYLTDSVSACWSPDGTLVAYATADGDINLIQRDGTGTRKLAHVGGTWITGLNWSPDGRRIRFSKDGRPWEMSSSGTNLHQLLRDWPHAFPIYGGQWTADGEFFVFPAGQSRGNLSLSDLWVWDERHVWSGKPSAEPVQLTSGPLHWEAPVLSKDGTKIFADGFIDRGELVRFDSKLQKFEPFLGGISADSVDFSRDGKSVVYVSYPEGILWKANLDGSKPVQLTESPLYPLAPRWSPDGSQIVFDDWPIEVPSEGLPKVYVVSSAGGSSRLLDPENDEAQANPTWSPDGRKIAFSRVPDVRLMQRGFHGNLPGIIYILDVATRQVSTLSGSNGFGAPKWSPDGRFIEAESDDALSMKIFDLTTQHAWVLQIGSKAESHAWSRDGRFIYFENILQGHPGVFRIPVHGGKPEMVVDLKDFRTTGLFGDYFDLDPTDAPLMLRFNGTHELYALTLER